MTDNKFFLRDEFSLNEKVSRLRADEFTIDNIPVLSIIDDLPLGPDEVSQMGKEEFLNNVRSEVSREEYREFIEEMFRKYGKKGDRFNQQLVRYPPNLETDDLREKISRYVDGPLQKPFDFILTQPLYINELREDEGRIDISFYTAADYSEYESEEDLPISILDSEGDRIQTLDPDEKVVVPIRRRAEVRIYTEERLMSISNSQISDRLQKEIYNIILAVARDSPDINEDQI